MSAILAPAFGDRAAIRSAEIGNACFNRAVKLGYSRTVAQQLSRQGKKLARDYEAPAAVALRVVPLRSHSATGRGPGPSGGFAA